jgi:recombination associated protein RdgC
MLFKALRIYELNKDDAISADKLIKAIEMNPFESVADSSVSKPKSLGWYPPAYAELNDRMVYSIDKFSMFCLRIEERKIKPSMVGAKLRKLIAKHFQSFGENPKSKQIKEYQEEVEAQLLRQIPPEDIFIHAAYDHKHNRIIVDASSSGKAEEVLVFLRRSLGSLPLDVWHCKNAPGTLFTSWLREKHIGGRFDFGDEVVLKAPGDKESKATLVKHELLCDEVTAHLDSDKLVQKMGITYDGTLSFSIDVDLAITKLSFIEFDVDLKGSSPIEAFDMTYSIVLPQYRILINELMVELDK